MSAAVTVPDVSPHAKTKKNPRGAGVDPKRGAPANVRITIRLTEAEHAAYLAAAEGEPLGEWIRGCCAARLKRRGK